MDVVYTLQGIEFEWHDEKAAENLRKHDINFETVCELFFDPFLVPLPDQYTDNELREAVIGMTDGWQLLYVVYTIREERVRLISARHVTKQERLDYENG